MFFVKFVFMKGKIKYIVVFLVSLFAGAMLNGAVLNVGMKLIPPPEGFDMKDPKDLAEAMKFMSPKHFITPFVSHALGTLLSSVLFYYFSKSQNKVPLFLIGGLFFCGGLYMVIILTAPWTFNLLDLGLAYFPMAYLGYIIGKRKNEL